MFKRFGGLYILASLFLASWVGQYVAMAPTIRQEGWSEFWAATAENWQSEFLQLLVQILITGVYANRVMRKVVEDRERLERKVDSLLAALNATRRP